MGRRAAGALRGQRRPMPAPASDPAGAAGRAWINQPGGEALIRND